MPWLTIVTTVLSLVGNLVQWLNSKQLLDAGAQQEISRQLLKIQLMMQRGKEIVDDIHHMTDDELNDLFSSLGKK